MAIYSHSKISTFEQCPYKYKLQYIDKVEVEEPQTIEQFMGGIVHEALELFYKNKKENKLVSKKELLEFYNNKWKETFVPEILIAKKFFTAEDYRKMGNQYVSDYYDSYKDDHLDILELETEEKLTLPSGDEWHIRIDKLCKDKYGNYYVCDYKTNSKMKLQSEADQDRQLGMYSLWVKNNFKEAKRVLLKWHMLAHNQEVISQRTEQQLQKLQEEVLLAIAKIEVATKENKFPTNPSKLCDYCIFRKMCPEFKSNSTN